MSEIQSIVFNKTQWSMNTAKKWIESNKFKPKKIDITTKTIRFRIKSPRKFKRFFTKVIKSGNRKINLTLGVK